MYPSYGPRRPLSTHRLHQVPISHLHAQCTTQCMSVALRSPTTDTTDSCLPACRQTEVLHTLGPPNALIDGATHSHLRLIFCRPTTLPTTESVAYFYARYGCLSYNKQFRASNAIRMSWCVDQSSGRTSSYCSVCVADEALDSVPASLRFAIVAHFTRVADLVALSPPTIPIKCHSSHLQTTTPSNACRWPCVANQRCHKQLALPLSINGGP